LNLYYNDFYSVIEFYMEHHLWQLILAIEMSPGLRELQDHGTTIVEDHGERGLVRETPLLRTVR
jgi:hypothetical protein